MHQKLKNILDKYSNIEFVYKEDKSKFLEFLSRISDELKNNNSGKINDYIQILEYNFLEFSKFDKKVLYNPIELFESILEEDFLWKKIDNDEFLKIIENMKFFEKYLKQEIKDREFLEKKYWIKINLVTDDIFSISAWIYWKGLSGFSKIKLISKIKKLVSFYPVNFIKNIRLDSIIVVESFYKKDKYWKKINLWWFETKSDDNIYLTRKNLVDSFDHELYHQAMQYYDDFDKWYKIRKRQSKKYLYKDIDKKVFGFARNYWKENISEDQATIAEELILNYHSLQKRIQSDRKLAKKVKLVKKAFLDLSEGFMDEKCWNNKFNK